ncbi:hypothetical protein LZC95_24790 [Pendulispora brunnea]|uniref:DUF2167 domain-containing protein n=1 Tax=Pendulispora brunnea TaxID=2905690 RepID=A0ABZ2KNC1_9BACT
MRAILACSIFSSLFLGTWSAWAVQFVDRDFRVDIVSNDEDHECVTIPETFSDPIECEGLDVADYNQRLRALNPGTPPIIGSVIVRGEDHQEYVVVRRVDNIPWEYDELTTKAFVKEGIEGLRRKYGANALPAGEPTPMKLRSNGVQLTGYEIALALPPDDARRVGSSMAHWIAVTGHGRYALTFASSPEGLPHARALAERSLTTLHATPGSRPYNMVGGIVFAAVLLVGVLVGLVVGLYFLVRALTRRTQAPKTYYGYNAPPPPPPAA